VADDIAIRQLLKEARFFAAVDGPADLRHYLRRRGEKVDVWEETGRTWERGFYHAARVIEQLADLVERADGPPA
jgi:hypothetical protein